MKGLLLIAAFNAIVSSESVAVKPLFGLLHHRSRLAVKQCVEFSLLSERRRGRLKGAVPHLQQPAQGKDEALSFDRDIHHALAPTA